MKQTKLIMGMPITIEIIGSNRQSHFDELFNYFRAVDERFSTYKTTSEMSRINAGLPPSAWSSDMKTVLELCEQTRQATNGYFDISHNGRRDPSGLVKGWAIREAANRLLKRGVENFYVEAGGDIQVHRPAGRRPWKVGIRSPFDTREVIKTVEVATQGVATSGTYIRGQHIYNPHRPNTPLNRVKSLTVIGPNIYEADRFATAAFAMGEQGIGFIENRPGLEGYLVTIDKTGIYTSGFERFVADA